MQFHLNGFVSGDPEVVASDRLDEHPIRPVSATIPSHVDVLIAGSGPAGLTLAAQLSKFPDITTCIVDQRQGPLELGQADGVACRTMEMFNAFGFAERLLREAYWVNETSFWKPAADPKAGIVRGGKVLDTEKGLSEFPHVILNQARVHDFYLEVMRKSPAGLAPHYGRRLMELRTNRNAEASGAETSHPVTVTLERTDPGHEGRIETVKARYVVGCDGARSAVRRSLGRELRGDSAKQAWGVMDVLAVTDFPDIRLKSVINSADQGSIVVIPREGGYLVRIYVELDELDIDERVAQRGITIEDVIGATRRVLHPYTFDVKQVAWWSVYEIGQRLCDRFDDLAPDDLAIKGDSVPAPHVFIAGDACHTHSPKAGQGMNVSMQDAFNLGWKLAAVLQGRSSAGLLRTYSDERQPVAQELIDFDRQWAAMLSAPARSDATPDGVDPIEVQDHFVRSGRYTAGTATQYTPSLLTATARHQHLAKGFPIGKRFHSAPVVRVADAKPMQLGHVLKADGRWRLFAFSGRGDPAKANSAIAQLCHFLANSPQSPIVRHTPGDADIDSVIDLRAVFQQSHRDLETGAMPTLLQPRKGKFGLYDYEKVFAVSAADGPDIFDLRGIDRQNGCLIVVRPDQYVSHVLPLDGFEELSAFYAGVLLNQA